MHYYLGIDVGTTSAKAVAFSKAGNVLASQSYGYKMYHPQPSWSEQDPEEVFDAVISCSNNIISSLPNQTPVFVAFSSAMHGVFAVDKNGKPITNCIIWADNRAAEIAEGLKRTAWGEEIYHTTGVPIHAMSPLCKLIWLKEKDPAVFEKAYKFISIKEYIYYKFFGEYIIDTSVASATGLLNIKSLSWDEKILRFLNLSVGSLSQVVSTKAKHLYEKPSVSKSLIPAGTSFIIGGSDGALANLGTGAVDNSSLAISIGTSSAARIMVDKVDTDIKMRTFCYHVKDKWYIVGGASNNGAIVLEWLKNNLLETKESFTELFERAEIIKPGSEDLIFVPYILGERAPIWDSKARGVFFGLNINHNKAHLIRACMEGIIFSVYSIVKILKEKREITEIYAAGGFTQSSLWLQMLADTCNIKVSVSRAVESSALGAVMIGWEAMEIEPLTQKEIPSFYKPDLLNHEIYMQVFKKFERIYENLKNEFTIEAIPLLQLQLK